MKNMEKQNYKGIIPYHGVRKVLGNELSTYAFCLDGLLIDTGPRRLGSFYRPVFNEIRIEQVALTHHHEDHIGNAAFLAKKGVPIYIHHSAVDSAKKPMPIPFYRKVFWGEREPFSALPLGESLETKGGKTVKVIETSGHTDDHVTFFLPSEGAIFTGDLFVSSRTKMGATGENYWKWTRSLETLLKLDFDTIYCSHAGIVANGRAQMTKKVESLKVLKERIIELQQKGMGSKEINKSIFPKTLAIKYFSGGEWDSIHIINSFMMGE